MDDKTRIANLLTNIEVMTKLNRTLEDERDLARVETARARAEAWDEGWKAGWHDAREWSETRNPYREGDK